MLSERLPVLVAMKTKPRVDALKWLFGRVAAELGEGVTALIIDDEADQASPNAAARKGEEAATYAELKALREAAKHHVWLSYTATPQAIFLTERDGALRPDYCSVSRPGTGYFGVAELMDAAQRFGRIPIDDWQTTNRSGVHPPASMKRAVCDVLCAGWLRAHHPESFYRRAEASAQVGMRSVQMLVHTNAKTQDHIIDYESIQTILATLRSELEDESAAQTKPRPLPAGRRLGHYGEGARLRGNRFVNRASLARSGTDIPGWYANQSSRSPCSQFG